MKIHTRPLKIALFLVYLALVAWICFGSFKPGPHVPRSVLGIPTDKIVHFLMFLPFPILGALAFDFRSWWRALCISTLLANACAFCFEHLQGVITKHRITDSADLNANFLGITLGLLISIAVGLAARRR